ncbi:MAG: mechanosensitive ion channel MscS, small conductance mechanosensitive channel [Candidatus Saccharibacteria bacterium]|nr:mechanosensitive ion channel MscS, small conductance mechanosensitive channel [Candidatus Saccharibacteria bacterium]MDB5180715.1 mechanosensitive ion channel MscS, small conductance mechanosensitive channel [Candidatus Saccharibacteria bacterium]
MDFVQEITDFFAEPNAYRSVLILIGSIILSYILSKFLAAGIIKIAQAVSVRSDKESNEERFIRLRQVETYLSVTVAVIRATVVAVVAYVVWRMISPLTSSGAAAIGASAFFVVFAGQTLGTILRDITSGAIMIIEQWFNVGDFVKIEPFGNVAGVVERLTLRSTKLRSISGEVVWIHNQQIHAAHVTPRGVRTVAVDVFVRDKDEGLKTLKELIKAVPVGSTMLASPLKVSKPEEWGTSLWRITITGQTAPGREWLIENFFVNAIKEVDSTVRNKMNRVFVYEPIARYADPVADKKFKRAVRARKNN